MIDAASITSIQSTYLQHISEAFNILLPYASRLFYWLATIEIVIFGLLWAFSQNALGKDAILKLIQISFIFFILQEYTSIVDLILKSITTISRSIYSEGETLGQITNPGYFWKYSYDISMTLLKEAASTQSVGLALTEIILGFSLLFIFALLGIQLVLHYLGFFVVAFVGLILTPLTIVHWTRHLIGPILMNIFKMGLRLMIVIFIMAIAIGIWEETEVSNIATSAETSSINQILGLLFSSLLFLMLTATLPKWATQALENFFFSKMGIINHHKISDSSTTVTPAQPLTASSPNSTHWEKDPSAPAHDSPHFSIYMGTLVPATSSQNTAYLSNAQHQNSSHTQHSSSPTSTSSTASTSPNHLSGTDQQQNNRIIQTSLQMQNKQIKSQLNTLKKTILQSLSDLKTKD